ncbi:tetratricopeptide repeat protein [Aestuariivirga sp.]|uniref:tetratricopeptide repeat protein n=1 Tax=Aestuariivirga sp. TaxID=2650926 RepID=UPI0025BE9DD4|nr:tetratricopeptide repeat protein [Aestuariivirga sp.]MCA3554132.1 sel1 repeat family protein [Aestuariivirga sp.]
MKKFIAAIALILWFQPAAAGELWRGVNAYNARNYAVAVAIMQQLAGRGDPYAEFTLGAMYDNGVGVPRNLTMALALYKRAGAQGLADGQYMAGRFYGGGRGVKQDIAKALFWFELAAAGGHPLAPLLRDQHFNQLSASVRQKVMEDATDWQSRHPAQLRCGVTRCIYPSWTRRPGWTPFDQQFFYPGQNQ